MAFDSSSSARVAIFSHCPAFSTLPPDLIDTHILPLLDGPSLASTSCVSSQLHAQCMNETLWRNICNATWPSINDPRVRDVISTFPSCYRSFFYNSFPTLYHPKIIPNDQDLSELDAISEFISAVDIHYKNKVVYSTVNVTKTLTPEGFCYSLSWLDLIDQREAAVVIPVKFTDDEDVLSDVAKYLTLSWIVIDPGHKLAVNLSSIKPVLVEPHWLNGYIRMMFSTLVTSSSLKMVEFRISVTCKRISEERGLQVMEVNSQVVDITENHLNWKDSLMVLQEAMVMPRKGMRRESYKEYLKMKRDKDTTAETKTESIFRRFVLKNIVGFVSMLIIFVPVLLWIIWYVFKRYVLRRKERYILQNLCFS